MSLPGSQAAKVQDPEAIYSKATKSELAKDYDGAWQGYMKSAELFLHLARGLPDGDKDKLKFNAGATKAINRATKIKAFTEKVRESVTRSVDRDSGTGSLGPTLTPIGINHYAASEQSYVLRKGELVNGIRYPLWTRPAAYPGPIPFSDPDGQPRLCEEQLQEPVEWRRSDPSLSPHPDLDQIILPHYIQQHIVADCSVVASIAVCLEHSRRFGSKLLHPAIQPFRNTINHDVGTGRFDLKLLFNGDWRRIVIDDKLPIHTASLTLMCMTCELPSNGTGTRPIIWPSILEKGYMKLLGGYDFLGSNSGIDLHAFIGWIPENISIQISDFERETTWRRLLEGFTTGRCLVTLGTGSRTYIEWNGVRFLSAHSYAVIDVLENNNGPSLTIIDSWTGASSKETPSEPKILTIPWATVLSLFDGIYLSWDPEIWKTKLTVHAMWRTTEEEDQGPDHCSTQEFRAKWRRTYQTKSDEEIWIMLTRHISDSSRSSEFISLKSRIDEDVPELSKHSFVPLKEAYDNSPHILRKVRVPESLTAGVLSIFASFQGQEKDAGFTLTILASGFDLSLDESIPQVPYSKSVQGAFTEKTAGGNPTLPSFMINPQYHLRIHPGVRGSSIAQERAEVSLCAQAGKDMPLNLFVLRSKGDRITDLSQSNILAAGKSYSYGFVSAAARLPPGDYTVILSAFEPSYKGAFTLNINSSFPCEASIIPQEDAGMYVRHVQGAWEEHTASGSPNFKQYEKNPIYILDVTAMASVKIRLQLVHPNASTALNVTIYPAPTGAALGQHSATSGGYDHSVSGVVTPLVPLRPGTYWVIPSTYRPDVKAKFQIIMYSTSPKAILRGKEDNGVVQSIL